MGDLIDLDAFRSKKEEEAEEQDTPEINYMRVLLDQLLSSLGSLGSGSIMVMPLSASDTDFTYYSAESGYNTDGYYEEEKWEPEEREEEGRVDDDNIRTFPPRDDDT